MSSSFHILVDSDALLGLYLPNDSHFEEVTRGFDFAEAQGFHLAVTNWVIAALLQR